MNLQERPVWDHRCLRLPGKDGIPTRILMQGCGCIYCGQPEPDEQKKIDAESARLLRETAGGVK